MPETSTGAATTILAFCTPAVMSAEEYIEGVTQLMLCVVTEMPVPSSVSVTRAEEMEREPILSASTTPPSRFFSSSMCTATSVSCSRSAPSSLITCWNCSLDRSSP